MYNDEHHYETLKNLTTSILSFKLFMGFVLTLVGGFFAYQVVTISIAILTNPSKVPFFALIQQLEPDGIAFAANAGTFVIPQSLFSYFVAVILLLVIASLSKKILEIGIGMVQIEISSLLNELLVEWREVRKNRREKIDQ